MLANRMQAAAAGRRKTLEFYADSFSTGATIQIPAGVQDGDVGFLFQLMANLNADSDTTPAGWSSVAGMSSSVDVGNDAHRASVKYRILTAALAGTNVTGMNGDEDFKRMVVFRPNFDLDSIVVNDASAQSTLGNPSAQTITAGSGVPPLLVLSGIWSHDVAEPIYTTQSPSMVEVHDANVPELKVAYAIYNEGQSPVNHTIDMADADPPTGGNGNYLSGGYFEFVPA